MKRIFILMMISLLFISCQKKKDSGYVKIKGNPFTVDNIIREQIQEEVMPEMIEPGEALAEGNERPLKIMQLSKIDIDLTQLSSTMRYTEVYNMVNEPELYLGKNIKMEGTLSSCCDEQTGKYYFACIIQDATACCSSGLEFELTDDYSFPDDYPPDETVVKVAGTFTTYMEGENEYITLKNAVFTE